MARNYANKLIASASAVDNLGTTVPKKPTTERQARPLTRLKDPELQQGAWNKAVESAPEGKVTGRHVSKVVNEIKVNCLYLNKE